VTTNEIILGVVCAVLVVFSLTVAIVVPKRNPDFPGRKLGLFFGVALVLVVGMLVAVEQLGEEEPEAAEAAEVTEAGTGEEAAPPAEPAPAESGAADTGAADTGAADTGAADTGAAAPAGDPVNGKEVFAGAGCASCHTLADAGATGTVGPNLDEAQPSFDLVVDRVTNGAGVMPSFSGQLSEQEIQDVAAYVVQATSG
jgi:mono/diheme cytochrome c family protein